MNRFDLPGLKRCLICFTTLIFVSILVGCRTATETREEDIPISSPTPVPEEITSTATLAPTETSLPTLTLTSTSTPEPTLTSTPTATPTPVSVVVVLNAEARPGPAENYPVLMTFYEAVTVTLQGSNPDGDWLAIDLSEYNTGWVPFRQVITTTALVDLPVVPTPEGLVTITPEATPAISLYAYEAFGQFFQCAGMECEYVNQLGLMVQITTRQPSQAFTIEITSPKGKLVRKVADKTDGEGKYFFSYPSKNFETGTYTIRVWTPEGDEKTTTVNIEKPARDK
jgi:uncharacterized protein YraI